MSKILDMLKQAFPKPIFPQKRYMVIMLVIYIGLKAYTMYTPDTQDDTWPDKFKSLFLVEQSV